MEIMEKSPLLYTVLFYSLCLTVSTQSDTKNDIQELARRLSLLEDKVVREQYREMITRPVIYIISQAKNSELDSRLFKFNKSKILYIPSFTVLI